MRRTSSSHRQELAVDEVLELPDVAGPGVPVEPGEGLGGERAARLLEPLRGEPDEVLREERDVGAALAEGRHAQPEQLEPVEEIEPEHPCGALRLEITVARRDHADVRPRLRAIPERAVVPVLEEPEQRHLALRRKRVDLVEEQCPPLGERHEPGLVLTRIGERAAAVAEQLVLDERLGERAAVHGEERVSAPRARVVEGARDEVLPGPGLPLDDDGHVVGGDLPDRLQHLHELARLSDHDPPGSQRAESVARCTSMSALDAE
jgi:hypothetical protein